MTGETRRIGMTDCLYFVRLDLMASAKALLPWDCVARVQWFEAAVWLLRQVPEEAQRMSWAYALAQAVNVVGLPLELVVQELWRRVEVR